jgi:hypothetical protein
MFYRVTVVGPIVQRAARLQGWSQSQYTYSLPILALELGLDPDFDLASDHDAH